MSYIRIPEELVALLKSISADPDNPGQRIEILHIPPGTDPETFVAEFIEKIEADHRATCPDCSAAHAAVEKAAAEALNKAAQAEPTRAPIGYMVFSEVGGVMRPIPGSFAPEREEVEKKLSAFNALPIIKVYHDLANAIGKKPTHEIRPVFGE